MLTGLDAPKPASLVTCEHGGNRVPGLYAPCFEQDPHVLTTHRAYDPGALKVARQIAARLACPIIYSRVTRLLVDLNRSITNRRVFSSYCRSLNKTARQTLLERYYHPYRSQVENHLRYAIETSGRVVHISVHSFTPELNGQVRRGDIGLLYDPSRHTERQFCLGWRAEVTRISPDLSVRRNYPYRGVSDGLTTAMRRCFDADRYLGIELELNQKWWDPRQKEWRRVQSTALEALAAILYRAENQSGAD